MNNQLLEKGVRILHRGLLYLKKYSPEILVATGLVGGAATVVMASQATLDLKNSTRGSRTKVNNVKTRRTKRTTKEYTTLQYQRDLTGAYLNYSKDILDVYWKPAMVGTASVVCILSGTGLLRSRNAALAAAYSALDTAYTRYRDAVREQFGEDKELEIAHNGTLEKCMVEDVEGNKQEQNAIRVLDGVSYSPYAAFFDELNNNWEPNPDTNLFFLQSVEKYSNHLLRSRGHLFLNEVYDALGIERRPAGQIVGWLYEKSDGDGYIDFGINRNDSPQALAFVNGDEPSILLDFNVDGPIFERI